MEEAPSWSAGKKAVCDQQSKAIWIEVVRRGAQVSPWCNPAVRQVSLLYRTIGRRSGYESQITPDLDANEPPSTLWFWPLGLVLDIDFWVCPEPALLAKLLTPFMTWELDSDHATPAVPSTCLIRTLASLMHTVTGVFWDCKHLGWGNTKGRAKRKYIEWRN